jgi:hypothetical protein
VGLQFTVPFVIDSGASQNIIDKNTWMYIKSQGVRGRCVVDNKALYPYGAKEPLPRLGRFDAQISLGAVNMHAKFYVLDCEGTPLLCKSTAMQLGVLELGYPLHTAQPTPACSTISTVTAIPTTTTTIPTTTIIPTSHGHP